MTEFSATEQPPYPIDDAALHHVFDGGWMWVLRFANGVTSAGVAMTDSLAHELRLAEGAPAWSRVLARFPSIAAQFADARAIREFTWMPRLAYRAAEAAGPGWAMLPSAAAFVDPLFSTGLPLTLLGIERLARALEAGDLTGASDYNGVTLAEADHTADFIAGCYAAFSSFKIFGAYSMFYFAAASFSEMARRLECAERPRRFLCLDDRPFGDATRHLSPAGLADIAGMAEYSGRVAQAIDPLNIAGLCEPAKRNWYRIDFEDTVRGAAKLGMSGEDVRARLYATCQDLNEQIVWKPSFS
jgi:FADH2 O2-dependent halogenase